MLEQGPEQKRSLDRLCHIAPPSSSSSVLPWSSVEAKRPKPLAEPHLGLATGAPLEAGGGGRCGGGAGIHVAR